MPLDFNEYAPLLPRTSAPSPVVPAAMDESSSSSLEIVAKHLADHDRPLLPANHRLSNLISPRLTLLEVAALNIALDFHARDGPAVESLISVGRGLQSLNFQRDEDGKRLTRQMSEVAKKMQQAQSSSNERYQRLQTNYMAHRDRLYEAFKEATDQWSDQLVELVRMSIDHVLHDSCKRHGNENDAGPSSDGS